MSEWDGFFALKPAPLSRFKSEKSILLRHFGGYEKTPTNQTLHPTSNTTPLLTAHKYPVLKTTRLLAIVGNRC
jgi:hypothetical protein